MSASAGAGYEPTTEFANGIRLDVTYYYWPSPWIRNRPGFMTGSGLPMRFADTNGAATNVYQSATVMTDESGRSYLSTVNTLLDDALGAQGWAVGLACLAVCMTPSAAIAQGCTPEQSVLRWTNTATR